MQLEITLLSSRTRYFGNDYANAIMCDSVIAKDKATEVEITFYAEANVFELRQIVTLEKIEEEVGRLMFLVEKSKVAVAK